MNKHSRKPINTESYEGVSGLNASAGQSYVDSTIGYVVGSASGAAAGFIGMRHAPEKTLDFLRQIPYFGKRFDGQASVTIGSALMGATVLGSVLGVRGFVRGGRQGVHAQEQFYALKQERDDAHDELRELRMGNQQATHTQNLETERALSTQDSPSR